MESNDLSLRRCGVRSITRDVCDIACIQDRHLCDVKLSVRPSRRQHTHIAIHVEQWSSGKAECGLTRIIFHLHNIHLISLIERMLLAPFVMLQLRNL